MKRKLRVVVDTNVIVSGIISRNGYPASIIEAWLRGEFEVIISKKLQEEVNEVFDRLKIKKRPNHSSKDVKKILGVLFNKAEKIKPKRMDINISLDIKDHFLLELAASAKADIIVSGDEELLGCVDYKGTKIMSPKSFCEKFL